VEGGKDGVSRRCHVGRSFYYAVGDRIYYGDGGGEDLKNWRSSTRWSREGDGGSSRIGPSGRVDRIAHVGREIIKGPLYLL